MLLLYVFCNFVYLSVLPMAGDPAATTIAGRGIQFASEDRVATAVMEQAFAGYWCEADGCSDFDFNVRLSERTADGGGAGLLRDEPGWIVLQIGGKAERRVAGLR